MKHFFRLVIPTWLIAMFFSHSSIAKTAEAFDCVSINAHAEYMLSLIDSGKYREVNEVPLAKLPRFTYKSSVPFDNYLHFANQVITYKKPWAELPCPINTNTQQLIIEQDITNKTSKQAANHRTIKVKHLVAPFELKQANSDKVIVLIHGLTDSPYSFHDLAYFFYQQGFSVRTLLLPGHGTAPSDLLDVDYEHWQQAADYIIERSVLDFDKVYLGGFSTGGALIFNHLMQQQEVSEKIKGLIMWSPASKAKSDLAWLAKWIDYIPFVDWVDKDADIDFAKYESFPFNAGGQVHQLMSNIIGDNARTTNQAHAIPLLVMASEHDQTIATSSTLALMNFWQRGFYSDGIKSHSNAMQQNVHLMYFGDAAEAKKHLDNRIKVTAPEECKAVSCNSILNIAHTSLTNAPNNPHYGYQGSYRNCGHYINDLDKYKRCKTMENIPQGEITAENLSKTDVMQRLTYNPHYTQMLTVINEFIEQ